jgi:uncharacterized protein (UPF0335 family)
MENAENLQSYVDRLAKLKVEQKQISEFMSDLKAEAKSNGFDPGAIDEIASRIVAKEELLKRRKDREETARLYAEKIGQKDLFPHLP